MIKLEHMFFQLYSVMINQIIPCHPTELFRLSSIFLFVLIFEETATKLATVSYQIFALYQVLLAAHVKLGEKEFNLRQKQDYPAYVDFGLYRWTLYFSDHELVVEDENCAEIRCFGYHVEVDAVNHGERF